MLAKCNGFRDVRHDQKVDNGRTQRRRMKMVDVGLKKQLDQPEVTTAGY